MNERKDFNGPLSYVAYVLAAAVTVFFMAFDSPAAQEWLRQFETAEPARVVGVTMIPVQPEPTPAAVEHNNPACDCVDCDCDPCRCGETVAWVDTWQEASDLHLETGKPIVRFLFGPNCPPCERLKAGVLQDETFVQWLNDNYIAFQSLPPARFPGTVPRLMTTVAGRHWYHRDNVPQDPLGLREFIERKTQLPGR